MSGRTSARNLLLVSVLLVALMLQANLLRQHTNSAIAISSRIHTTTITLGIIIAISEKHSDCSRHHKYKEAGQLTAGSCFPIFFRLNGSGSCSSRDNLWSFRSRLCRLNGRLRLRKSFFADTSHPDVKLDSFNQTEHLRNQTENFPN